MQVAGAVAIRYITSLTVIMQTVATQLLGVAYAPSEVFLLLVCKNINIIIIIIVKSKV